MAGGSQGVGGSLAGQLQQLVQQNQGGPTYGLSNYASPNQNFMQYPQQGQPNQGNSPQLQTPAPALNNQFSSVQNIGGPDVGGNYAPTDMGFDNSGSDGGGSGQPTQMQTPLQQGSKPPSMSQFRPPQGLQIQGNPTSQVVQRPQQR